MFTGKVVDLPAPKPFQSSSSEAGGESKMLMEAGHYGLEAGYLVPDTGSGHPWASYPAPGASQSPGVYPGGQQSPSYQSYFQFPSGAGYGGVDHSVKVILYRVSQKKLGFVENGQ